MAPIARMSDAASTAEGASGSSRSIAAYPLSCEDTSPLVTRAGTRVSW